VAYDPLPITSVDRETLRPQETSVYTAGQETFELAGDDLGRSQALSRPTNPSPNPAKAKANQLLSAASGQLQYAHPNNPFGKS
jgi:hypothetical protein